MLIGVISDTHGVFSPEIKEFLSPVDQLWHAGDFGGGLEFADSIAAFKPMMAVHGNCDGQDIRRVYPEFRFFECEGRKILLKHIGGRPGHYDLKALALIDRYRPDIFVCGHSHILLVQNDKSNNLLHINPGACGNQGWHVERTALRFRIDNGEIHDMELFRLPRTSR